MPKPITALALAAAALTLAACGQKAETASVPEASNAPSAANDAAAIAPAAAPAAPAIAPPPAPASSAIYNGPGTGPQAYAAPAPMSNPTSATGKNNPPSDVLAPR